MDKNRRAAEVSRKLRKILKKGTYKHVVGVAKTAAMLAGRFGADKSKAEIAGLLHDCAKDLGPRELGAAVKKYRIKLGKQTRKIPAIWHGLVARKIAEKEFGIKDPSVLRAIAVHSTGGLHMGKIEKIIYAADFIEPGREYRESRELRKLLKKNITLDYLVYSVIIEKIKYLKKENRLIHPSTKLLFNQIKRKYTRNT
jgi:predicted HD superfamily hydrolase involved in NAD metabolism